MIQILGIVFAVLFTRLLAISASPDCHISEKYKKCGILDSDCLTRKSNGVLKSFVNGIPELGIETLDKLCIDSIPIYVDGILQDLNNVKVEGLKNATITEVSFDDFLKVIRLSFDTTLIVTCDYVLDGYFFLQPIYGSGTASFTLRNTRSDMVLFYDILRLDNGRHILNIKDFRYGLDIKGGGVYVYDNLYNGDKVKGKKISDILGKNWPIISNVFGKNMYDSIYGKIYEAIKTYLTSRYLEDMVSF